MIAIPIEEVWVLFFEYKKSTSNSEKERKSHWTVSVCMFSWWILTDATSSQTSTETRYFTFLVVNEWLWNVLSLIFCFCWVFSFRFFFVSTRGTRYKCLYKALAFCKQQTFQINKQNSNADKEANFSIFRGKAEKNTRSIALTLIRFFFCFHRFVYILLCEACFRDVDFV